jgi:hypothetical protein
VRLAPVLFEGPWHKDVQGSGGTPSFIFDLGIYIWISGFLLTSELIGKNPWCPLNRRLGGPHYVCILWRRIKSLVLAGNQSLIPWLSSV